MKPTIVNRTENYYKKLTNAEKSLENELTLSHLLRFPNTFTSNNLSYGEIIAKKLNIQDGFHILEVGPGLGDLAENICSCIKDFHYTFCDISYEYIRYLKNRFKGKNFSFECCDFLELKTKEKFDVIISNEVLGDLPTIINIDLKNPKIKEEDKQIYFDAVMLIKFYNLKISRESNFNYGALKFIEKAKSLLNENGKIFVCEHSSKPVKMLKVYGHNEFTIDFDLLENFSKKLGFQVERGCLSNILGIKNKKAVIFYTNPELRIIHNFFSDAGIPIEQRVYEINEIIELLENKGVKIYGKNYYFKLLNKESKNLKSITDQFNYLILQKIK